MFCWRGSPQPGQSHLSNENVFLKFIIKETEIHECLVAQLSVVSDSLRPHGL